MKLALEKDSTGARALMERVLRGGAPIAPEYPMVFEPGAPGSFVTIESEGEVRSACAILVRELVTPAARIQAGLIGSVVTHPDWRGRGFGGRLIAAAEEELRRQGCVVSMLWADAPLFYEKRGYREFGSERDFVLPLELCDELPNPHGVRELTRGDEAAIHALYLRHDERVERSAEETAELLLCPGMEVLVCERFNRVVAYSCLGRGADFTDVVHEWGGNVEDVLRLLRAHTEKRLSGRMQRDIFLMAPTSAGDLYSRLAVLGAPSAVGILGFAKLIDASAAAALCAQLFDREGGVQVHEDPAGSSFLEITGPRGRVTCTSTDVFEMLFAARGERGAARAIAERIGASADALPLSPFVWGLDSI